MSQISSSYLQQIENRIAARDVIRDDEGVAGAVDGPVEVLIVEDEEMVADMYSEWIAAAGYGTTVANGGRAALRTIGGETDVVLLDRRMPVLTGDEVLEVIRSEDIDEVDPAAFADGDPDAIYAEMEKHGVTDVDMETAKKLDRTIVENLQNEAIDPQVCMVTAVDPGFGIIDLDFEHYVTKDVESDELVEIVEALTAMTALEDRVQEYQSLRWKEILLLEELGDEQLRTDDRYLELQQEIREIETDAGKLVEAIKSIDRVS